MHALEKRVEDWQGKKRSYPNTWCFHHCFIAQRDAANYFIWVVRAERVVEAALTHTNDCYTDSTCPIWTGISIHFAANITHCFLQFLCNLHFQALHLFFGRSLEFHQSDFGPVYLRYATCKSLEGPDSGDAREQVKGFRPGLWCRGILEERGRFNTLSDIFKSLNVRKFLVETLDHFSGSNIHHRTNEVIWWSLDLPLRFSSTWNSQWKERNRDLVSKEKTLAIYSFQPALRAQPPATPVSPEPLFLCVRHRLFQLGRKLQRLRERAGASYGSCEALEVPILFQTFSDLTNKTSLHCDFASHLVDFHHLTCAKTTPQCQGYGRPLYST